MIRHVTASSSTRRMSKARGSAGAVAIGRGACSSAGTVAIAYYADDFVVLHEAAHAWFNGSLLADRWANEAFASYYGAVAAEDASIKVTTYRLTPELEKAKIPLKTVTFLREARAANIQHNKFLVLLKGKTEKPAQPGG